MQIPINKLTKMLRTFPQWSTAMTITFCLYLLFIMVVLSISFPLKSHKTHLMSIKRSHVNENTVMDIVSDNNELGDSEEKLMQRAKELPTVSNRTEILRDAFNKADLNGDSMLTIQELARYINRRIREHIEASIRNNPFNFSDIDRAPRNGLVTWDEYHAHFLRSHGFGDNKAVKEAKWGGKVILDRNTKDLLARDRASWNDAARTDSFSLTLDEFLAFQHPESSAANMLSLVDDLLRQFDENGDEHLTVDEFSNVVADDLDDKWRRYMIEKTIFQRQEEFKRLIDKNHDGIGDRSELLSYVSPKHPRHALQEAAALFNLADRNRDQWLTFQEIEKAGNIFMASSMVNSAQTFHDDF